MTTSNDQLGDLIRGFYAAYGRPDEGPPPDVSVTTLLGGTALDPAEQAAIRATIDDMALRRQFRECRDLLEELATRLTSEELLRELSAFPVHDRDFEQLSSGVFWFGLAASLDRRQGGMPTTPMDAQVDLPLPLRIRMSVHGSLVLRLYVALVYMREGPLHEMIERGARARNPCCGRVRRLLDCDYLRRIRNALAHGSFSATAVGIAFRDDSGTLIASPDFLGWLCIWLMLIQLQGLSAGSQTHEVA
jgi:hypothetical protein